jgi:hypothetical protein
LHTNIEKNQFTLKLQHNLRTVPFHQIAAYPTVSDIQAALDLFSRSGCGSIVAVGSGAAMDLAKAMHSLQPLANLILIPQTLGAVLASTAKETLIFCPHEDALLPLHATTALNNHHHDHTQYDDSTIQRGIQSVLIDSEADSMNIVIPTNTNSNSTRHDSASLYEAAFAALVITLDAALQCNHEKNVTVDTTFHCILQGLQKLQQLDKSHQSMSVPNIWEAQQDIVQALIHAGSLLTFRPILSLSYTFSSALLPQFFPHGNWLSFTSSLLPGILSLHHHTHHHSTHHIIQNYNSTYFHRLVEEMKPYNISLDEIWTRHSRTLASFAEGTPSYDALLDKMDAHCFLLGEQDRMDSHLYKQVLIHSLNK